MEIKERDSQRLIQQSQIRWATKFEPIAASYCSLQFGCPFQVLFFLVFSDSSINMAGCKPTPFWNTKLFEVCNITKFKKVHLLLCKLCQVYHQVYHQQKANTHFPREQSCKVHLVSKIAMLQLHCLKRRVYLKLWLETAAKNPSPVDRYMPKLLRSYGWLPRGPRSCIPPRFLVRSGRSACLLEDPRIMDTWYLSWWSTRFMIHPLNIIRNLSSRRFCWNQNMMRFLTISACGHSKSKCRYGGTCSVSQFFAEAIHLCIYSMLLTPGQPSPPSKYPPPRLGHEGLGALFSYRCQGRVSHIAVDFFQLHLQWNRPPVAYPERLSWNEFG